jgi:SAM-dependent methyltransferase
MKIHPEKQVWDNTWSQQSINVHISHTDKIIFKYLINMIDPKDNDIIELGCGRGVLSYLFSSYIPKSITLLDFSKEALKKAKKLFHNIDNVNYVETDILNLEMDLKFDIVFSSGVVEHFSGDLRIKAIAKHFELSKNIVAFIVPAKPHYNTIRHKKKQTIELFGWQEAFSKSEMNFFCNQFKDFKVITNKRFYPMYGITFYELFSIDSSNYIACIYNFLIKIINKIFYKLKVYRLLNTLLLPFEDKFGGLMLVIAEKEES